MPEQIPDFTQPPRPVRKAGPGIQWWMLENEAVWQFTRGIDFHRSVRTLVSLAYAAAKRKDMTAHVVVIDDDHVQIQFTKGRAARRNKKAVKREVKSLLPGTPEGDAQVRRLMRGDPRV